MQSNHIEELLLSEKRQPLYVPTLRILVAKPLSSLCASEA